MLAPHLRTTPTSQSGTDMSANIGETFQKNGLSLSFSTIHTEFSSFPSIVPSDTRKTKRLQPYSSVIMYLRFAYTFHFYDSKVCFPYFLGVFITNLFKNERKEVLIMPQSYTPELKKENLFPKKSGGILCEGNRLVAYRFIQQYGHKYGVRWLLKRLNILPNAYYNYLKNRKADYHSRKDETKSSIREIYHSHGGVDGYRTVHAYLLRKGYSISCVTVHKYMNTELQLFSITRKRKA